MCGLLEPQFSVTAYDNGCEQRTTPCVFSPFGLSTRTGSDRMDNYDAPELAETFEKFLFAGLCERLKL
jgi:hypothetical protein